MGKDRFKKASWINNTNVYEVNLRQYTAEGTINAFMREMPRLKSMGVETLWFMPLTPISQKNRKGSLGSYYACSDYTAVNPEFGNLEDVKNLVALAHEMGMKVIIDWVANHTGWDHVWTLSNPDFYLTDSQTGTFKIASGMDDIIELNYDQPSMRRAMIDAMAFWIRECDIDGFRCDLAFWVRLDFWLEARAELEKLKTMFWLAESDVLEHPAYLEAFDAAYSWSWMHKTEDFYKKKSDIGTLKNLMNQYQEICGNNSITLWFTSNHDENSWNGTEYEKYGDMLMALNVFSFTRNGMPLIYSGQELPCRKRLAFFDKDPIEWDGRYALQEFYQKLLLLRKHHPALRAADRAVDTEIIDSGIPGHVIAFYRRHLNDGILVFLNFSEENISFQMDISDYAGLYKDVFGELPVEFSESATIELPSWGYLVYEKI